MQVGNVAHVRLADDGVSVLADAFIEAPHDRLVTDATRFWDTSGFAFTLGPEGATLDVSSLAALVSGGVAFDRLVSGGDPVEDGTTFELFEDRDAAQASIFSDPDEGERVFVSIVFSGDVAGLASGSPVELRGVRVGEITAITGFVDEERFGDRRVRLLATAELRPEKLGVPGAPTAEDTYAFLEELVASGVRAQLARGNILTGGLKVDLVEMLEPAPASFDTDAEPYPILPSVAADLPDVAATAEGVFRRINALPIEELLDTALSVLDGVEVLVASDAVKQAPEEAVGLISDLRGLVGAPEAQALPGQAADLIAALKATGTEAAALLEDLRQADTVATLTSALDAASQAGTTVTAIADEVGPAVADIPRITGRLAEVTESAAALVAEVAALPLDELMAETTQTVAAARTLLDNPDVQQVPAALSGALNALEGTLGEVQSQGLVAQVAETLGAAQAAADAVAGATADLPALVERIGAVAGSAQTAIAAIGELPFDRLVADASDLVQSANALVGAPATQRVPEELAAALAGVDATLAEVREAGLVAAATDALTSADSAAGAVADATAGIPALVERLSNVATAADGAVQSVAALPLAELTREATQSATALRTLLASPELQAMPAEATDVLAQLDAAIAELRAADLATGAAGALASADEAAQAVAEATAGLPALVERTDALAASLTALPLGSAVEQATSVLASLDTLIASDAVAALPSRLAETLAELQAAVAELRQAGVFQTANAALASADRAAEAVAQATAGVPGLVDDLSQLTGRANALPLDALVQQATGAADAAQALLTAEGAQEVPTSLNAALAELQAAVAELRQAGVFETANAALTSADRAAEAVAQATAGVPGLVDDLSQLTGRANALPLEALVQQATEVADAARALLTAEGAQEVPTSLNAALDELQATLTELREGGLIASANATLASTERAADAVAEIYCVLARSGCAPRCAGRAGLGDARDLRRREPAVARCAHSAARGARRRPLDQLACPNDRAQPELAASGALGDAPAPLPAAQPTEDGPDATRDPDPAPGSCRLRLERGAAALSGVAAARRSAGACVGLIARGARSGAAALCRARGDLRAGPRRRHA